LPLRGEGGIDMAQFSYDDIESAFEYVSAAGYGLNSAYLDVKTEKIFYRSELMGTGEPDEEDTGTDPLLAVPHKNDLGLGQSLVFEFVEDNLPDAYDEVRHMFRKRGAYSRYKELLSARGILEAWHRFEQDRTQKVLRSWCEQNEVPLADQA
jgi:hypothetical protein